MNIMYHRNGGYLLPDMGLNETGKDLLSEQSTTDNLNRKTLESGLK